MQVMRTAMTPMRRAGPVHPSLWLCCSCCASQDMDFDTRRNLIKELSSYKILWHL